jgi:hypothetical protein
MATSVFLLPWQANGAKQQRKGAKKIMALKSKSAGIYPGDDNYLTTEQMRTKAISVLQTIRQSTRGTSTGGDGSGEPKGLKITGADSQVLPADGSAAQQEDGSYSGRVDRSGNAQAGRIKHHLKRSIC